MKDDRQSNPDFATTLTPCSVKVGVRFIMSIFHLADIALRRSLWERVGHRAGKALQYILHKAVEASLDCGR
jgi:hypothetical protein